MSQVKIVNVVATASLNQPLNFQLLNKISEISYRSDVYSGQVAYFKTKIMKGRISLFLSGKMISVGTKSPKTAFYELRLAAKFLTEKGFIKPIILQPKIRNLVVTATLHNSLNLEKLAEMKGVIYEPEQFPAVILHMEGSKATAVIFQWETSGCWHKNAIRNKAYHYENSKVNRTSWVKNLNRTTDRLPKNN